MPHAWDYKYELCSQIPFSGPNFLCDCGKFWSLFCASVFLALKGMITASTSEN